MDVTTLGFLLLMALMGGVIAFYADRLGRKLGKSRHTLFGLRPRRTAELLTFSAGFLIPILTILIVMAVSAPHRQWILRGSQAISDAKRYEAQADDLQKQVDNLSRLREQAAKDFEAKNTELTKVQKQGEEIEKKRQELQKQVASLNGDISRLNKGIRSLEDQTKKITAQYTSVKTEFDRVRASFNYQNEKYNELLERNTEIERANAQLERDRTRLNGELSSLQGKIGDLEKERDNLEKQVAQAKIEYQKELDDLNGQLSQARTALENTQRQLNEINQDYATLLNTFGYARTQRVTFYQGEELVRVAIPPRLNEEQSRISVNSLLRQAISAAEARGAVAKEVPTAALIVPVNRPDGTQASARDQIESMIQRLRNLPDHMFIVAVSRLNAFVGEPVAIEVLLFHNPVVYEANDTVGDVRIDGSRSEAEIFDELTRFFAETIGPEATKKGMRPTFGSQSSIGNLTTAEVLQLIRRIRDVNAPVRVYALAARQTRAGDRLELVFRFR